MRFRVLQIAEIKVNGYSFGSFPFHSCSKVTSPSVLPLFQKMEEKLKEFLLMRGVDETALSKMCSDKVC